MLRTGEEFSGVGGRDEAASTELIGGRAQDAWVPSEDNEAWQLRGGSLGSQDSWVLSEEVKSRLGWMVEREQRRRLGTVS